jgi:hypothetical protein
MNINQNLLTKSQSTERKKSTTRKGRNEVRFAGMNSREAWKTFNRTRKDEIMCLADERISLFSSGFGQAPQARLAWLNS